MTWEAAGLLFANCCGVPLIFFVIGYALGRYHSRYRIRLEKIE